MKNSRQSKSRQSGGTDSNLNVDAINVVCRFRPFPITQKDAHQISPFVINTDGDKSVFYQSDNGDRKHFSFDKMFGFDTTQEQIFSDIKGVVVAVMDGINGTVLAYGQTSSGKSHTMEGVLDDSDLQGVIPRAVDVLFACIDNASHSLQFQIKVAYYEIYCEKIRDLLNPTQDNLKLREVKDEGFVVQDITEIYCGDAASVLQAVQVGKSNRASAPTLMNAESSRSHSILSITVRQKDEITGRVKSGRLFLVDLAGSEKVGKTGAKGTRLEEAKNINSSLTTLGMVINSLCDGAPHVPYRDSKLTRLLMDSLGGNSRTTMIICCSPEAIHSSETLSTLRFGERAKRIENHAKVNEELSAKELQVLLNATRVEITRLQKQLSLGMCTACGGSVSITCTVETQGGDEEESVADSQAGSINLSVAYSEVNTATIQEALMNEASDAIGSQSKTEMEGKALFSSEDVPFIDHSQKELEIELETERLKTREASDTVALLRAEIAMLRTSIGELEARLLQAKLDTISGSPRGDSSLFKVNVIAPKVDVKSSEETEIDSVQLAPDEKSTEEPSTSNLTNKTTTEVAGGDMGEEMALLTARSEADEIRSLLEQELRTLEQPTMTPRSRAMFDASREDGEIRSASHVQMVAKLREEYESYIQRLMVKVLEEQQHRCLLEDKLEEFNSRNWRATSSDSTGADVFKKEDLASLRTQRQMSVSSPGRSSGVWSMLGFSRQRSSPVAPSPLPLHTQMEMAQSRMAVLASELQAARESHMIVLETKDAMMHSLVQQNTQLIAQQEESSARTEELEAKVNQLTQLLRTVTAPIISPRVPRLDGLNSASAFTAIKGGRGGPDTPKKIIEF